MNTFNKNNIDIIAIIPSAGIGRRFSEKIPKQYLKICGKTIQEHSIEIILKQKYIKQLIVVINKNDNLFFKSKFYNHPKIKTIIGSSTRAKSVMAALNYIRNTQWILIHDAVRPCLCQNDIDNLLKITSYTKIGGILATPINNTIKYSKFNKIINYTVNRNNLWNSLTPQLFKFKLLKKCLKLALSQHIDITDESYVLEYFGYNPLLINGSSDNIKITNKEDVNIADFFLSKKLKENNHKNRTWIRCT
ncbi:MAG: 2-C-methyl-D-erythritol 4-phosphate cytidylyltransferase [Enterobacterales bacterium]